MSKIQVMDEVLANKIAAGEVVEKTMNVVKELVENSLDAASSEIKIELKKSGVKEIKVIDNGTGMDKEDAKMAFLRHATSKLKNLDDLFNIESLGFRGEALPSIASVSNITLKTSNGKTGTLVELEGGKNMKISSCDLAKGTKVTVTDLFYNTPVRLKYLKNLYIELANITEYVNKIALAHPSVKFSLSNDDKILLETDGNGDLQKVIYKIYGIDIAKKSVYINAENDDYEIDGYITYPEVARSNRNAITTFVNGRLIKNNELNRVIIDSYHTYIPKDKFPIIVLNINVDPILIDINIHPTKMDIKFSKMDTLKELIEKTITHELEKIVLIPNVSVRDKISIKEVSSDKPLHINSIIEEDISTEKTEYEEISLNFDISEKSDTYDDLVKEEIEDVRTIKKMIPEGIVFETYIIAENDDGMFIIDQHAAAERINYEKYLKEMSKEVKTLTDLLIPISIELPTNEFIIVKEHLDLLKEFGFIIEEFGQNTLVVRSHPTWLIKGYEEASIRKIIEIVSVNESFSKEKFIEKTAITLSCRMSIKAHDYISVEDMEYLLDKLTKCDNPFTCPHGRPTIITYTKYDLERLFKRSMN